MKSIKILLFVMMCYSLTGCTVFRKNTSDYKQPEDATGTITYKASNPQTDPILNEDISMSYYYHWCRGSGTNCKDTGIADYDQEQIDRLKDHAQLVYVHTLEELQFAAKHGLKSVLVFPPFGKPAVHLKSFKYDPAVHSADAIDWDLMLSHSRNWWNVVINAKGENGTRLVDSIEYLYPVDEPHIWNEQAGFPHIEMSKILDRLAKNIKTVTTESGINKKLLVAVSPETLFNPERRIPAEFDVIGFDCYGPLLDCPFGDVYKLMAGLDNLAESDHQKFLIVPEAWYNPGDSDIIPKENNDGGYKERYHNLRLRLNGRNDGKPLANYLYDINFRLKHMYEIAINDPRFEVFMPFTWASIPNDGAGTELRGAADIPEIHPNLFSIADNFIKQGPPQFANTKYGDSERPFGAIELRVYNQGQTPNEIIRPKGEARRYWGKDLDANAAGDFVKGWAYDPDQKHMRVQLRLFIDNQYISSSYTNIRDHELNKMIHAPGVHGFIIPIADLGQFNDGKNHQIYVYAVNHDSGMDTCEYTGCKDSTKNQHRQWDEDSGIRQSHKSSGRIRPDDKLLGIINYIN